MSDRASYFKRRIESIPVHGVARFVLPMSGSAAERLIKDHGDDDSESVTVLATVMCSCACDESGARLFTDDDVQDVMDNVDLDVIKAVAGKALDISGMGADSGND